MKKIDADYYGYRDEDDGVLVPLEKEAQKKGTVPLLYPSRGTVNIRSVGSPVTLDQ